MTVVLLLAPHPSWLTVLVNYHLRVLNDKWAFFMHLAVSYTLAFLSFSSLIIILVRDPGPVESKGARGEETEELNLTQALLGDDVDFNSTGKWCRKCWAPKPERAHQCVFTNVTAFSYANPGNSCSHCGRCVLKMGTHSVRRDTGRRL